MTSWKKLLANKQLIERVEFNDDKVTLHFVKKYNNQKDLAHIADAIVYLYSASNAFQEKFRRPQKKSLPELSLRPHHGFKNAAEVLDAFSHFAMKNGAIIANETPISVKALTQFANQTKPKAKAKPTLKIKKVKDKVKNTKIESKSKTQSEIRVALAQNTLFKLAIKGTDVKLTLTPDFADPVNYRAINQVLASLQRSSLLLKKELIQIKNVNRKPRLTLKTQHSIKSKKALITALMDAAGEKPTVTAIETVTRPVTTQKAKTKARMPKETPKQEAPIQQVPQAAEQIAAAQQEVASLLLEAIQPQSASLQLPTERGAAVVTPELVGNEDIWGDLGDTDLPLFNTHDDLFTALERSYQLADRAFDMDDEEVPSPAIPEPLPSLFDDPFGSPQKPLVFGYKRFLEEDGIPGMFEGINWQETQGLSDGNFAEEHSQARYISPLELK